MLCWGCSGSAGVSASDKKLQVAKIEVMVTLVQCSIVVSFVA